MADTQDNPLLVPYIGEKCKWCGHVYEGIEDLRNRQVVGESGTSETGAPAIACRACFDKNNYASRRLRTWAMLGMMMHGDKDAR